MLNTELIYNKANDIVTQCGTRDVDAIAHELGLTVLERDDFKRLLGMYTYQLRHRLVFLSSQLDEPLHRIVLAHEIGHDTLHRPLASSGRCLQEFTLFDIRSITEYEANALAAHLLIDNDEVYALAKQGYDIMQISQMLGVHANLMLIKMQEMNRMGYGFKMPCTPHGDYLKKVNAQEDRYVQY